jgi:hypothetical protein
MKKSKIDDNDKIIEWDDDDGISASVSLIFDSTTSRLWLYGKKDDNGEMIPIGDPIDLVLSSALSYAKSHKYLGNGVFSPELPGTVTVPSDLVAGNTYLVMGIKLADGTVNYTFSDLSGLITHYSGGDGVSVEDGVISVKKDLNSDYNLSVSNSGIKYTHWSGSYSELTALVASGNALDGIYYVEDDAE